MDEDPVAGVLKETVFSADIRFVALYNAVIVHDVHEEDCQGDQQAEAPSHQRVGEEPLAHGVPAGNHRLLERPEQVKTHDRHPGEHRHH